MTNSLNSAQTIFTLFFTIYFATAINSTKNLDLFNTSALILFKKHRKSCRRIILAFIIMDLIPILYFYFIMQKMEIFDSFEAHLNLPFLLLVFIESTIGFGLYRLLFGLLMWKEKKGKEFYFYDVNDYLNMKKVNVPIQVALDNRPPHQQNKWLHIFSGSIWILLSILSPILFSFIVK